jgi:cell division protein FtsB
MDGAASHHLVSLRRQQRELVLVSSALVCEAPDDSEPDFYALLWQCLCILAWLFGRALVAVRRLRLQLIELRLQANYYRAQHQRAVQREADLKEQVRLLQGEIRELKRRLYGRKSETASTTKPTPSAKNKNNQDNNKTRSRGQQPGSKGHGRTHHDHLPTTLEDCVLPKDQQCCATCGEPFVPIPGSATGDILEIEVRAHRRRYQRHRYRRH